MFGMVHPGREHFERGPVRGLESCHTLFDKPLNPNADL